MAQLPCSVFLEEHFKNGGVNQKGYDILNRTIGMIGAIGWEIRVIVESEIATGAGLDVMEGHMGRILHVCEAFNENMTQALVKAEWAANTLPDLEDEDVTGDKLDDLLTTWRYKLRALHQPTGNDTTLFKLIFLHYDDTVHERVVQLHRQKPEYRSCRIFMRSSEVYHALKELYQLADQADTLVSALKDQNQKALDSFPEDVLTIAFQTPATSMEAIAACGDLLTDAVYKPRPEDASRKKPDLTLSKSFGVAEAETARCRHGRAADAEDTEYTTVNPESPHFRPNWKYSAHGRSGSVKGRGAETPRLFVESQRQLRKLHLNTARSNENQDTDKAANNVEVRDFVTSPREPECTSPGPQSPLQRCDAFISRETEVQDRIIKGEVFTTRRPSTSARRRAKTLNEPKVGLEAWWDDPALSPPALKAPDSGSNRKKTM